MLVVPLLIIRQRRLFCSFVCRGTLTCYGVGALSIPYNMHLVVPTHPYFFWVVCHPSRTFPPKEPEQESQNRFSLSPPPDYTLLPLTHDPPLPVLAGYRLVKSGPYARSTPACVQNLPVVFAVFWKLLCTFCHPSLTFYGVSCFLISLSLWFAPLRGWALFDCGLFLLQPTLLLLPTVLLPFPATLFCHSCCDVI